MVAKASVLAGCEDFTAGGTRSSLQRIGARLVVHFLPPDGRVEHAGQGHFRLAPKQVLVVLVQQIDGAGANGIDLAVLDGFDLAFAADAVDGLEVVLVVNGSLGTGKDAGDVEGEPHVVVLEDQPGAVPVFGLDQALGIAGFFQCANDHCCSCNPGSARAQWWVVRGARDAPLPEFTRPCVRCPRPAPGRCCVPGCPGPDPAPPRRWSAATGTSLLGTRRRWSRSPCPAQ